MRKPGCTQVLVYSLGLGIAAPAIAQEAPGASAAARSGPVLEEIFVTARRISESAQDVPISMTVYKQERLSDLNIVNAVDLATYTPSLSANPTFGAENASLAIRGFKQDLDTAPSVGVYFADVVVPRGATQGVGTRDVILPGSMFDLQNLQVLKGPQGTLFGRNTTGGAVLVVPREPGAEFGGYLQGSVGNYDMVGLQGAIDLPLADDLRLRIAADGQKRDGYADNIAGTGSAHFEDENYKAIRTSLIWDVTDDLENYTIASYYRSRTKGTMTKLIACNPTGYDPVNIAEGLPNFMGVFSCGELDAEKAAGADFFDVDTPVNGLSRIEQWQVINTTTWKLRDTLTLKNILSYAEYENTQKTPLFATNWQVDTLPAPYPTIFFRGVPAIFTAINAAPGTDSADQSTYTEELQAQGSWLDERLTYQAGVYLEWSDPLSKVGNQSPTLVSCTDLPALECSDPLGSAYTPLAGYPVHIGQVGLGLAETTFRNQGVYAQSTYSFTEQLNATAGIRYTWDEQKSQVSHTTTTFPVEPPYTGAPSVSCTDTTTEPSCHQSVNTSSDKPTWLLDLDYFPLDDLMVYGKYARGYRSGGIVGRAPFDYRTFDPEKLDNYEIGFKSSFRGVVSGTFNVAAFYNDLTNQQLQVSFSGRADEQGNISAAPVTGIANAGKSEVYGTEVETTLTPLDGLIFSLSYTWLHAEIKKIDPIHTEDPLFLEDTTYIEPGSPILQTPENQLTASLNYTLPSGGDLGQITLGVTYVYLDDQFTSYVYQDPELKDLYGGDLGKLPSFDLWSANLNWEEVAGLPVDLSLFATNLTDEKYYTYVPGLAPNGLETASLGQPRMYGLRMRYRFGAQ